MPTLVATKNLKKRGWLGGVGGAGDVGLHKDRVPRVRIRRGKFPLWNTVTSSAPRPEQSGTDTWAQRWCEQIELWWEFLSVLTLGIFFFKALEDGRGSPEALGPIDSPPPTFFLPGFDGFSNTWGISSRPSSNPDGFLSGLQGSR